MNKLLAIVHVPTKYIFKKRQLKSLLLIIYSSMASTHAEKKYLKKDANQLMTCSTSFRCIYTQIRKLLFPQNNILSSKKPVTNK